MKNNIKKLNFGCGNEIWKDYDNVDIQKNPKIHKSFDFDIFPYPLKDNTYDYVYSRSVLEHINEPDKVLLELWRICKSNAIIEIIVPEYTNKSAYADLQHKHFFSDSSFVNFVNGACKIDKKRLFDIDSLDVVPTNIGKLIPKRLRAKVSLFLNGINSYVHVKLRVKK